MVTDAHVDMKRGKSNSFWAVFKFGGEGVIDKIGQIVKNKIFLRMLGTIPNSYGKP